ncbi:MAG: hypothetical protein Q8L37_05110 [Candidatus Gottesmanbacteria bacterium]|nr:hypothetical protein [Candidatus Gottesmanbacteria bacterium]
MNTSNIVWDIMTSAQISFGIATIALLLFLIFLRLNGRMDKRH